MVPQEIIPVLIGPRTICRRARTDPLPRLTSTYLPPARTGAI